MRELWGMIRQRSLSDSWNTTKFIILAELIRPKMTEVVEYRSYLEAFTDEKLFFGNHPERCHSDH